MCNKGAYRYWEQHSHDNMLMKWTEVIPNRRKHIHIQKDMRTTTEGKETRKKQYGHNKKTNLNGVQQ